MIKNNYITLTIILLLLITTVCYAENNASANSKTEKLIRTILNDNKDTSSTMATEAVSDNNIATETVKKDQAKKTAVAQIEPTPDSMLLQSAIKLYQSGLTDDAEQKFLKLKKDYANSPYLDQANVWLGQIYLKKHDLANALKFFNEIKEEAGEYPLALYYIGMTYKNKSEFGNSIEYLYKLAHQYPDNSLADDALLSLAEIYSVQNKGSLALSTIMELLKKYPDRETLDNAYFLMGQIFQKNNEVKDIEKARGTYKIFITKAETNKETYFVNSPLLERTKESLSEINRVYFNIK